jgi:hypothetical protein
MVGADFGIMVYGYNESDAKKIKKKIEGIMKKEVDLISGSQMENKVIKDILESGGAPSFEENEKKVMMFLGDFSTKQLQASMKLLPPDGNIDRPIFCTVTDRNFFWTLSDLIEDLLQEEQIWKERKWAEQESPDT